MPSIVLLRKSLLFLFLGAAFWSCKSTTKNDAKGDEVKLAFPPEYNYSHLEGIYSGDFDGSSIHLSVRKATGRNVVGYSIHKGVKRNFSGLMEVQLTGFHMSLKEPGNSPYDGIFDISLDTNKMEMTGVWTPKDNKTLSKVTFKLNKTVELEEANYEGENPIYYDSINTLTFSPNGLCNYEFYPVENNVVAKQMVTVRGSWVLQNGTYTIDWEKNTYLKEPRSIIPVDSERVGIGTDYYSKSIRFNGRRLAPGGY